jgi:hypothetical protein
MPLPEDERSVVAYLERNPDARGATVRPLDFVLEIPRLKRSLGALLDVPIELDVDDGRIAALRVDDARASWQAPPGPLAINENGSGRQHGRLVGVVMSTSSPWRLDCFVVINGVVQAVWSHGAKEEAELRKIAQIITYEEEFQTVTGLTFEALTRAFTASHLSGELPDVAAHADEATITVSMALREVLADRGWRPLFSTSPAAGDNGLRTRLPGRLVSALSVTGLVNSYSTARTEVAKQLASRGHDLDELIAACNRLDSEHGVRLLDADTETVRASV